MKKYSVFFALIALISVVFVTSCKNNDQLPSQMVDVTVSFSGIDIQVTPEDAPMRMPAASDKDADQASVKRIALSVYDSNGSLIASSSQNKDVDATGFGAISLRIPIGSYKFVAVAHTVAATDDPVATINSVSSVSLGSAIVGNPTYMTVQDVTISGNTTQSVTVDMGTRKNATFTVKVTDATPADVKSLNVIISPASTLYTDLEVDPATGFAKSQWQFNKTATLTESITTFTNQKMATPLMLTAATQNLDVTINALDASGQVLYTRTLQNVPFQQGHKTLATGTFFSPDATSSFSFDVTEIVDNISLD